MASVKPTLESLFSTSYPTDKTVTLEASPRSNAMRRVPLESLGGSIRTEEELVWLPREEPQKEVRLVP